MTIVTPSAHLPPSSDDGLQRLGVAVSWWAGDREIRAVFPGDALEAVPTDSALSEDTRAALSAALDGESCERAISHFCARKQPAG